MGLPAAAGAFAPLEHPYHVEGLLLCQGVYCNGARGAGADDRDALDGHLGRGCVLVSKRCCAARKMLQRESHWDEMSCYEVDYLQVRWAGVVGRR